MTKWIGLEGTYLLAKERRSELVTRYPESMIDAAEEFERFLSVVPEAATAIKSGVSAMHDISEGGVFSALWQLAESSGVGLEIDMKKIISILFCVLFMLSIFCLPASAVEGDEDAIDAGFFSENQGYAAFVEYGRKSGKMPPVNMLMEWLRKRTSKSGALKSAVVHMEGRRKRRTSAYTKDDLLRSAAWSLAKWIAKRGTQPHPFFAPAVEKNKKEIEKARIKNQAVYIACMVWGKDPDEVEQKGGPVAGRDVPINESALKGLMM